MTEDRKKLIDKFQKWLDTNPRKQIIAAQCATIAEEYHAEQLRLGVVVKSLPTEQCVRDWYKEGDIDDNFWKHSTEWSNEYVFKEVYKALKYFINRWQ